MRLQEGPGPRGWFKGRTKAKLAGLAKRSTKAKLASLAKSGTEAKPAGLPEGAPPSQARPAEAASPMGEVPIGSLRARDLASVAGRVRDVAAREGRTASVEAELSDGTGQVVLVWMGRRRIVGLEAGAGLTARGRVARLGDGRLAIYNPTYELRP